MITNKLNLDRLICILIRLCFIAGGHRGKWWGWQVKYDPKILQGNVHQGLQKNHRRRFFRKTNRVS